MDRRAIALLSAGHACVDLCQGAIPALLPALIAAQHLSYAAAAGLVFAATAASSVIQPLFGHFADRLNIPWLMPVGVLIAGSGLALTSAAPGYWPIALCMCISGIGVAAYHPEAARVTHYIAGNRKATGMSMFSVGGNIGFALGPLAMTALLVVSGLRGTPAIMVPLGVTALLLFLSTRRMSAVREETLMQNQSERSRSDAWGPFLRLTSALTCRSMVFYGLNTFLPLYWIVVLHQSQAAGGIALSVLLLVGLSGTLLGGRLADRYGRRLVVLTALGMLAPSLLLFPLLSSRSPVLAVAMLVPLGLALFAPTSVMIVMGQEYLPNRVGTASGVTLGLAVSAGGIAAPVLGRVADVYGIPIMLASLAAIALVAFGCACTLPRTPTKVQSAQAPAGSQEKQQ
jgi:FSR family fosmidomycin resistance protein-like MFS transporter